ncbi:MAG TPA: ABC transporter permease, partial [Vicinamibacterales bacterium]|nr:ABC transporter permease [Vicinamibacterales bacterium]
MTNGDRPSRSFAPGPIARAALRCVPDRWRDSVTRDLIEEATRSGRGRSTGELWIAFHACRIAQTLRRQASSASSPLSPRRSAMLGQLGSDLGFAFRMLRRQWRPSAAIVLTLALGIGATTTVYAVFNHLVLRPMPGVREPERLVSIVFQPEDQPRTWASGVLPYEVLGAPGSGLESIALWSGSPDEAPAVLHPGDDPRLIEVEFVAPDYLETLGVRARIGRLFTAEETRESGHQVALISEHLWQRDFGGRDDVLGRSINVRGEPFVIAGVLDDYRSWSATPANHADVWLPEPEDRAPGTPLATVSLLVARLAPGQDASTIQSRLRQLYEPHRAALTGRAATLVPWVYPGLRMGPTGGRLDAQPFSVIFGASALLLLLACANAANLLLATNARRRQDLALRAAIGASRPRLMRGLIVEAVVLGAIAVAAGLALTWTIAQLVDGLQIFSSTGALSDVTIDWRVVLFASAAGVATVLVFALMPILAATRLDLRTVLQEHSRGATTSKRVGRALVAVQLALSLTLMAGAGVLVRSLWNLRGIDLGIRPEGVYGFTFDPRLAGVRGA